jgi:uncharacterized LabA/DUF88 family protein
VAEREVAVRRPLLLSRRDMVKKLTAYIYVDGFNLFYGSLKRTSYKWLDLNKLAGFYFPKYEIKKIKYFSAVTKARKDDLDKPVRQLTYFRALRTLPNLEIISGTFLENEATMFVPEKCQKTGRQKANVEFDKAQTRLPLLGKNYLVVKKTEEKGSDVNLATHLIVDVYEKKFDVAIIVSNDSDLAEPIKIANSRDGLKVRLLNPYKKTNHKLQDAVNKDIKIIRKLALANSQFFDDMVDINGDFHKPDNWKTPSTPQFPQ